MIWIGELMVDLIPGMSSDRGVEVGTIVVVAGEDATVAELLLVICGSPWTSRFNKLSKWSLISVGCSLNAPGTGGVDVVDGGFPSGMGGGMVCG